MNVLSAASEQQIQDVLVSSGMLDADKLAEARKAAKAKKEPLFGYLVKNNYISDEQLTKANATVTNMPYVNLTNAKIDPKVLQLLPQDIAERYMAVPLGEMQHRLVVAMLDADNVQAVDYLSNRIGRPLKVYVASEAGIRQVLRQYEARLDTQMKEVLEEGRRATRKRHGRSASKKRSKRLFKPATAMPLRPSSRTRRLARLCRPFWSSPPATAPATCILSRWKKSLRCAAG